MAALFDKIDFVLLFLIFFEFVFVLIVFFIIIAQFKLQR